MLPHGFINAFIFFFVFELQFLFALLLNFLGAVPLARCHWAQECYQGFSGTFLPKLICSQLSFNHRRSAVHVVRNFALFADVADRVVAN